MLQKFQEFILERQYLHNVTPATVEWHTHNLKWLKTAFLHLLQQRTRKQLQETVCAARRRGQTVCTYGRS